MISLMTIYKVLLMLLIIVGGMFVSIYEKAPWSERLQVLGVGIGMYVGLLLWIL